MDPNANLKYQLELAERLQDQLDRSTIKRDDFDDDIDRLCALVLSLNTWIADGGFLPTTWQKN